MYCDAYEDGREAALVELGPGAPPQPTACEHSWARTVGLLVDGDLVEDEPLGVECERCGVTLSREDLFAMGFVFASNRILEEGARAMALADQVGELQRIVRSQEALVGRILRTPPRDLAPLELAAVDEEVRGGSPVPMRDLVTWWIEVGSRLEHGKDASSR